MKQKEPAKGNHHFNHHLYLVLIVVLAVALLAAVVYAVKSNDRAPRFSFAFSGDGISDGKGNVIDINGGGKFSYMAGGLSQYYWFWNVYIDGHGRITFVANEAKEFVNWKPVDGLYDQVTGNLTFTLKTTGKLPSGLTEPIKVTLIEGGETAPDSIIVTTGTSTYTGTGVVVISGS